LTKRSKTPRIRRRGAQLAGGRRKIQHLFEQKPQTGYAPLALILLVYGFRLARSPFAASAPSVLLGAGPVRTSTPLVQHCYLAAAPFARWQTVLRAVEPATQHTRAGALAIQMILMVARCGRDARGAGSYFRCRDLRDFDVKPETLSQRAMWRVSPR